MSLIDTPTETKIAIIEQLHANPEDHASLLSLSATCSHFRTLLLPYVLRSITLRNTEKSGSSIEAIANCSNSCQHVKELHFIGSAPGSNEETFGETENILPDIVQSILAGLQRFPNLRSVSVEFDLDLSNDDKWEDGFYIFDVRETPDENVKAESNEGWRALMAKTWTAISHNTDPHFKAFEIRQLLPIEVSTFREPQFHRFLSTIECFSLSTHGNDNGVGWRTNTMLGVGAFYDHLDALLFDHLINLKDLRIMPSEEAPLGSNHVETGYLPLALRDRQMPLLQSVHLERTFVCPDLIRFLVRHSGTLMTVVLHDCMGSGVDNKWTVGEGEEVTASKYAWAYMFERLSDEAPKQLKSFLIESTDIPLVCDYDGEPVLGEAKAIRDTLRDEPGRRLFLYQDCDDKYGNLLDREELNREAFLRGDDQREYDRLMEIVEANQ